MELVFLGILLLILALGLFILNKYNNAARTDNDEIRKFNEANKDSQQNQKELKATLQLPVKTWHFLITGILFIFFGEDYEFNIFF